MLEEYLRNMSNMRRTFRVPDGFKFACFEEFVLKNGRYFNKYMPRPKWVKKGIIKECFRNCFNVAGVHRDRVIYCEGYAVGSMIPVHHAWLVTHDGTVIDPTWHDRGISNEKTQYFGIAFDWQFVLETAMRTKYYGVIDNWHEGFPLLKSETTEFLWKGQFLEITGEAV